jgi:single-strand DNA-binding protein
MDSIKNSIQLIGNLGRDPEITKTSNGNKVGKVTIATNEAYKTQSGERVQQTQWHNLIAWGEAADQMELLRKGNYIGVRGKIRYKIFENKEGQKQNWTEVLVQEFLNPASGPNGER